MSSDHAEQFKRADIETLRLEVTSDQGPGEFAKQFNRRVTERFRANGGKLNGELTDAPIVLVTMIGSKSGNERTVPLSCIETEGRVFVVASRGGTDDHPIWFHNITANPTQQALR